MAKAVPVHGYRADIQGLRALAVVPVVLFHAMPSLVPGGFLGVDIFFVISGYLITQILLRDLAAQKMSIAGFYVKRVKRLFPALYVMLFTTVCAGIVLLPDDDREELFATVVGTVLFSSNIVFLKITDYFGGAAEFKPLLHTWSLAVEEQFYLVFPPLLAFLFARFRGQVRAILWSIAALSFIACIVLVSVRPDAAFYLPFTRAWELLAGALLAAGAVPRSRASFVLDAASLFGLGLIVASMALVDQSMTFPGWVGLPAVIGTVLVLYGGEGRLSWAGRALSLPMLVWIGGLSYSLYLWHWPILVYLKWLTLSELSVISAVIGVAVSVLAAWASLVWIERPALRLNWSPTRVLASGGGTIAACVTAVMAMAVTMPAAQLVTWKANEFNPRRQSCHGEDGRYITYELLCEYGPRTKEGRDIVWGDSYGAELPIVLAKQGRSITQATSSACPPSIGYEAPKRPQCDELNARRLREIANDGSVRRVYLVANYMIYPDADAEQLVAGIYTAAKTLREAGKQVEVMYPLPQPPMDVPDMLELAAERGMAPSDLGTPFEEFDEDAAPWIAELNQMVSSGVAVPLRLAPALCRSGVCRVYEPGVGPLYFDRSHLGIRGLAFALSYSKTSPK